MLSVGFLLLLVPILISLVPLLVILFILVLPLLLLLLILLLLMAIFLILIKSKLPPNSTDVLCRHTMSHLNMLSFSIAMLGVFFAVFVAAQGPNELYTYNPTGRTMATNGSEHIFLPLMFSGLENVPDCSEQYDNPRKSTPWLTMIISFSILHRTRQSNNAPNLPQPKLQ